MAGEAQNRPPVCSNVALSGQTENSWRKPARHFERMREIYQTSPTEQFL